MKTFIYFCSFLFVTLGVSSSKSFGQAISYYWNISDCTSSSDSIGVVETGYISGDSVIVYNGDGTLDSELPYSASGGSAYYYFLPHIYTAPGTYTKKIVLISGGVRVDSETYTFRWYPCEAIWILLYADNNSNCLYDGPDMFLSGTAVRIKIDSAGVPVDTVTASCGAYYQAYGPTGTVYTFTVLSNPHGFVPTCPATGTVSVTLSSAGYYQDSIGFECDPTACLDHALYSVSKARLGGAAANIFVNTSSCTPVTATTTLTFSTKYTLDLAGGAPYTVSGNVITFTPTVSATSPWGGWATFNPTSTLTLGDTAHFSFATSATGDCNTSNNTMNVIDTIRASYDPNHKSVRQPGPISAGSTLEYMLEFENTGNGVAENVHLLDTLSDNLDINTIAQISSSAQCRMILMRWAGHNIVKFDFPGIMLADSSHKPDNQGFVSFSIKAKTTLPPGTHVDNRAGIYFDTNPVVLTNNVRSTIPLPSGTVNVNSNVVDVYPNPVNDLLNIKTPSGLYNTINVSNTLGQIVMTKVFTTEQIMLNVTGLPAGIYYITLKGESGVKVQKFEKM